MIIAGSVAAGATGLLSAQAPAARPGPCGAGATGKNIAGDGRCFELRRYTIDPKGAGSADLLHARFREHSLALFRKHGMTVVGFWQPLESPYTLIYLMAYTDGAAREKAWTAFRADPEWIKVRTAMNVTVKVEEIFMNATDYGPMK
jgi:hypothetical protein